MDKKRLRVFLLLPYREDIKAPRGAPSYQRGLLILPWATLAALKINLLVNFEENFEVYKLWLHAPSALSSVLIKHYDNNQPHVSLIPFLCKEKKNHPFLLPSLLIQNNWWFLSPCVLCVPGNRCRNKGVVSLWKDIQGDFLIFFFPTPGSLKPRPGELIMFWLLLS